MRQTLFATTIVLLFMSLLAFTASADSTCINSSFSAYTTTIPVNGAPIAVGPIIEDCSFGCNVQSGECNSGPFGDSTSNLYFIMPIISFVLLYLVSMFKPEDWYMQILLIGAAMYFIVAPMGVIAEKFAGPFVGLYQLSVIIAFIVVFYYIIKVLMVAYKASAKGAK